MTNAGGLGIQCADACEAGGLEVPALSPDSVARLRSFLPAEAGVGESGRHGGVRRGRAVRGGDRDGRGRSLDRCADRDLHPSARARCTRRRSSPRRSDRCDRRADPRLDVLHVGAMGSRRSSARRDGPSLRSRFPSRPRSHWHTHGAWVSGGNDRRHPHPSSPTSRSMRPWGSWPGRSLEERDGSFTTRCRPCSGATASPRSHNAKRRTPRKRPALPPGSMVRSR